MGFRGRLLRGDADGVRSQLAILICLVGLTLIAMSAGARAQAVIPLAPDPNPLDLYLLLQNGGRLNPVCRQVAGNPNGVIGTAPPITRCVFTSGSQIQPPSNVQPFWLIEDIVVGPTAAELGLHFSTEDLAQILPRGVVVPALISINDSNTPFPAGFQEALFNCEGGLSPNTINDSFQVEIAGTTSAPASVLSGQTIPVPLDGSPIDCQLLEYTGTATETVGWNVTVQYVEGPAPPSWKDTLRRQRLAAISHNTGVAGMVAGAVGAVVPPRVGIPLALIGALLSGVGVFTGDAAIDPVDPNFTTVVTPAPPNVDVSSFGPATAQLIQNLEQAMALSAAVDTTQNRAAGAYLASDAN